MRKGYSDPRIAASLRTASHNMGLFVDLYEIPQPHLRQAWSVAMAVAVALEKIQLSHAAERQAGLRAY